jgi:hypothetical protein
LLPVLVTAQAMRGSKRSRHRGSSQNKEQKYVKSYVLGIGAANFLGELGGANQTGTFFVKDFEFSQTRVSAALGVRYKFKNHIGFKGGLHYMMVSGDDKTTQEPFRQNRNLSFRSNIFELSGQFELFLNKEQQGHIYKIKSANGVKSIDIQAYGFVGFGAFYFNPKAKYQGNWVALQPLGTEGQGLPGGAKKYSRVNICIPYGIGGIYSLDKDWSIGLEIGIRKTFTDYIDDVSTEYFDNNKIRAANGSTAAYLADPSIASYPVSFGGKASGPKIQTATGEVRGQSNNMDSYMFININIIYKVSQRKRTRSKF